jgi:hypothetical protein
MFFQKQILVISRGEKGREKGNLGLGGYAVVAGFQCTMISFSHIIFFDNQEILGEFSLL